jgi:hypothetical protein
MEDNSARFTISHERLNGREKGITPKGRGGKKRKEKKKSTALDSI